MNTFGRPKPTTASAPLRSTTPRSWSPVDCTWWPSTGPPVRSAGRRPWKEAPMPWCGGKATSWRCLRCTTSSTTISSNPPCGGFQRKVNVTGSNGWTNDRGRWWRPTTACSQDWDVRGAVTSTCRVRRRSTTSHPSPRRQSHAEQAVEPAVCSAKRTVRSLPIRAMSCRWKTGPSST